MVIDKDLISRLEYLAKLELSDNERARLQEDLNSILAMVDKLNELNTEGVEPLTQLSREVIGLRADVAGGQLERAEALRNAPDQDGTYFRVPKVIPQRPGKQKK